MKFTVVSLAAIVAVTAASPADLNVERALQRRADVLEFDCKTFGGICQTQCYGAYCRGNGVKLRMDLPSTQEKRNRRKDAGCIKSGGNRCSTKQNHAAGYQCDEFPYASTKPSGSTERRLNKCVVAADNNKQGGALSKFYREKCAGKACDFEIKMTNGGDLCDPKSKGHQAACTKEKPNIQEPGNLPAATSADTADDGTSDADAKRSVGMMRRYVTNLGREVELDGEGNIGRSIFQVVARNATLFEEHANGHVFDPDEEGDEFDYMHGNLEVREEVVVRAL